MEAFSEPVSWISKAVTEKMTTLASQQEENCLDELWRKE
jgi:hypothetical protein